MDTGESEAKPASPGDPLGCPHFPPSRWKSGVWHVGADSAHHHSFISDGNRFYNARITCWFFPPDPGSPQRRSRIQAECSHHTSRCQTLPGHYPDGGKDEYSLASCVRLCKNMCIFKVSPFYKRHICLCSYNTESTNTSSPNLFEELNQ